MSNEYNEDFFEMNKLDSVNSINLDVQKNKGSSHSQNVDKQTDKSNNTDSAKKNAKRTRYFYVCSPHQRSYAPERLLWAYSAERTTKSILTTT